MQTLHAMEPDSKRRRCDLGSPPPQLEHELPDPLTVFVDTSDSESGDTVYFYGELCSIPEHVIDDSGTDVD